MVPSFEGVSTSLRSLQRLAEQELAQYEAWIRAQQDKECWLKILKRLGISRQEFECRREELSTQLDEPASVYDTVWIILKERGVWEEVGQVIISKLLLPRVLEDIDGV